MSFFCTLSSNCPIIVVHFCLIWLRVSAINNHLASGGMRLYGVEMLAVCRSSVFGLKVYVIDLTENVLCKLQLLTPCRRALAP